MTLREAGASGRADESGDEGSSQGPRIEFVAPEVRAALLERWLDGVVVIDEDSRIMYANRSAEEILGVRPGSLRGESASVMLPEGLGEPTRELLNEVPAGQTRRYGTIRRSDGATRDIEYSSVVVDVGGRRVSAGLFRDVTGAYSGRQREQAFARIAASVAFADSLETTLDGLAVSVAEATAMTACAVIVCDDASPLLRVAGTHGLPADYGRRFEAALDSGVKLPGVVAFESGRTVTVDRASEDPALGSAGALAHDLLWATLICLPMTARGEAVGVLKCFFGPEALPDRDEMAFLAAVADQAAVAVENARLFAESRERLAIEERHRLARDLHDSVSQAVFSMTLETRAAQLALEQEHIDPCGPVGVRLARLRDLAQGALAEMRALIFELRPEALSEEGLVAALRKHAAGVSARSGVVVEIEAPEEVKFSGDVEEQLYRVGQEALNNVLRHAEATHARIRLAPPEATAVGLILEVSDDGAGFDPGRVRPGHFGLTTMRQRVERLGGTLDVMSAPGLGSTIRAVVPAVEWRTDGDVISGERRGDDGAGVT